MPRLRCWILVAALVSFITTGASLMAADGAVASGVGRMSGRAFGESLREEPGAVLVETLLEAVGIQDHVA